MVDKMYLYGAIILMLIVIAREYLKKYFNIDMDKIDVEEWKDKILAKLKDKNFKFQKSELNTVIDTSNAIKKGTGTHSLVMLDAGVNKATVMATLRQITGIDYKAAKTVVESIPTTFMVDISEKEAELTKKALEFVGAKIQIK